MPDTYSDVTITSARREDLVRIIAVDKAAASLFEPTGLLSEQALDDHVPDDVLLEAIETDRLHVVRSADGDVLGFTLFTQLDQGIYLDQISVHPVAGRRGLGRKLMLHLDMLARDGAQPHISLSTFRHLAWNGPFYKSLGYRNMKRRHLEPYMIAIEHAQRPLMDVSKRVFMRKLVRAERD